MSPSPILRSRFVAGLLLLGALLSGAPLLASGETPAAAVVREVPEEMVGAWCPAGGCETRSGGPWNSAGFALSVGAVVLLSRRHGKET